MAIAMAAKAKIDVSAWQFTTEYWKYLLVIALFGLGNSSNAFLILRTQDIGAFTGDDDPYLRGVQSRGRVDFISGRFVF